MNRTMIGYGRVSTRDQNPDSQYDALIKAGCDPDRIYIDHGVSGKLANRPQLDAAMKAIQPGNALVVTRLSRLGRSVKNLLKYVDEIHDKQADLVVVEQQIDTTTPSGRLTFHLMAAIDEFQRDLIVENTREGLEAARARGRVGGRRSKLAAEDIDLAQRLYDSGEHTVQYIADRLKVSRQTIYRSIETAQSEAVGA